MKKQSSLSMVCVLGIICLASACSLGFLYMATEARIIKQREKTTRKSLMEVVPVADPEGFDPSEEVDEEGMPLYYTAYDKPLSDDARQIVGFALKGRAGGYSSTLVVMVGLGPEITSIETRDDFGRVKILGAKVLEQQETPGLGAQCQTVVVDKKLWRPFSKGAKRTSWTDQFENKFFRDLKVVKGNSGDNIEAITGATITSNAVVAAVGDAVNTLYDALSEGGSVAVEDSLAKVVPDAARDGFKPSKAKGEDGAPLYYTAYDRDSNHVGYAVVCKGRGYSGTIVVMVGVDPDIKAIENLDEVKLLGVRVIEQRETPGMGDQCQVPLTVKKKPVYWTDQFAGKSVGDLKVVKGKTEENIEAITQATLTSKAVVVATRKAVAVLSAALKEGRE